MKYKELIKFTPIVDVIQLIDADEFVNAKELVETYVISERMKDNFVHKICPNLQFLKPSDNKGLLIVGNYGTGKSHLMVFISSIAEYDKLDEKIHSKKMKKSIEEINNGFEVIRTELGATTRNLRDNICAEIERGLEKLDINFKFPSSDKLTHHKNLFVEMMSNFQEKYPNKGLLFIVDELLDYLVTRKEAELIYDLNFLREIGEICSLTRFRFIAGIQESLFDNPRFQFAADSIRRVKDRFEQVNIVKEDVAFVVSERLLNKNSQQKNIIKEHLEKFTSSYGEMNERLNEYIDLFPIHPAYLDTFERIYFVENRQILKTISSDISKILEKELPYNETGIISFDSYWEQITEDPSLKAIKDIKDVIDIGSVLTAKIKNAYTKKQNLENAFRIINALCVYRLTTRDIRNKIGLSPQEIRDQLCISTKNLPQKDPEFVRISIQTILQDIMKLVSGQFISLNKENGQYYIDIEKDIDYELKIKEKAETLDSNKLNIYYYNILTEILECVPLSYVTGFRIWEHEILWREKSIYRKGYLFLGSPNERSTAQPPRDFYLYFIQPFEPPEFIDENKTDELFFFLTNISDDFTESLKLYAASKELSLIAGDRRSIYENLAQDYRNEVKNWLKNNLYNSVRIVYQGEEKQFLELHKELRIQSPTYKESINGIASLCLSLYFEDQAPEYPNFSVPITHQAIGEYIKEAFKTIRGVIKTKPGIAILDGLELLDGDKLVCEKSRYAQFVLNLLNNKKEGQVLNRDEMFEDFYNVEYLKKYRLEPELVIVILASLIYTGDIVLSFPGLKIDVTNIEELNRISIDELINFKHIEKPKDIPLDSLIELFSLLKIPSALITNPNKHEEAIKEMQQKVEQYIEKIIEIQKFIRKDLTIWNSKIFDESNKIRTEKKLDEFKNVLESLRYYNTPGKLKNFKYNKTDIKKEKENFNFIYNLNKFISIYHEISPMISYLSEALIMLPENNEWLKNLEEVKSDLANKILDLKTTYEPKYVKEIMEELMKWKESFIELYFQLHKNARLNYNQDKTKKRIINSSEMKNLCKLKDIRILDINKLQKIREELQRLKTCFDLTANDLQMKCYCIHCNFRLLEEETEIAVEQLLTHIKNQLDILYDEWLDAIIENLENKEIKENIELLEKEDRTKILSLLEKKELPEEIDDSVIKSLNQVLSGLEKVVIDSEQIKEALMSEGMPCTTEDLQKRFNDFINKISENKDKDKLRIIID